MALRAGMIEVSRRTNLSKLLRSSTLVLLCTFFMLILSCENSPPPALSMVNIHWATYENLKADYSLQYPSAYSWKEHHGGRDVQFRYDGFPLIAINRTTEEEARKRGLWAKHRPVDDDIVLGGRVGRKYIYRHYDGPFYMQTLSYVVEDEGKYVALEFRTQNTELDSTQKHIVESFTLKRRP